MRNVTSEKRIARASSRIRSDFSAHAREVARIFALLDASQSSLEDNLPWSQLKYTMESAQILDSHPVLENLRIGLCTTL